MEYIDGVNWWLYPFDGSTLSEQSGSNWWHQGHCRCRGLYAWEEDVALTQPKNIETEWNDLEHRPIDRSTDSVVIKMWILILALCGWNDGKVQMMKRRCYLMRRSNDDRWNLLHPKNKCYREWETMLSDGNIVTVTEDQGTWSRRLSNQFQDDKGGWRNIHHVNSQTATLEMHTTMKVQFSVTLSDFHYIGQTEDTGFVEGGDGSNPFGNSKGDDRPRETVSWDDCWEPSTLLN